jgi:hypothetical protein
LKALLLGFTQAREVFDARQLDFGADLGRKRLWRV